MSSRNPAEPPYLDVPPDPERIIEGLRDTGYEFNTAMADVIDNSIAAGAGNIDITIAMDFSGAVAVSVADDGCGMDRDGLVNAMRYGSRQRANQASLGKFGLGLKTASTAFCRRLSAVSRGSDGGGVMKATWDLDHIAKVGRWELQLVEAGRNETTLLDAVAKGKTGTLILWENIDRLLKTYAKPDGKAAKTALKRYEDELRFHVAMVYQRFLDSNDARAQDVSIRINGRPVAPWDPYCLPLTEKPAAEKVTKVETGDGASAAFTVRVFILPRKSEFPDEETLKEARLTNDKQGIYVYRENRLIHGPDWLDMYSKEPHMTLCRVELSFDHKLDDAFQVDIKKSRILLDEVLYDWLRNKFLPGPRREASERYRKGVDAVVSGTAALLHAVSNNAIHAQADNLKTAELEGVDGATGNVTVSNKNGVTKLRIKLVEEKNSGECHVQPVDSLQDGLLWEPAFINGNQAVRINTGHSYYQRVYIPNRRSGVTVQGLDSLMWGLCAAELGNVSESNRQNFEEMRYEVSRILRRLADDLPEPSEDDL
ncbi:ATP-binding protein [Azoarcus sp. L1K30]|uniref:ATP-binding protein n=1 Tax=Azoarcus sp. L1K30 TaxID=2820277 RepID=UPI001B84363D|nr:ATP-binding protein [Azoarcus sp. L1K30]MBR0565650.1 ATP-binding protein [Azoarcus sp. L1K30]